MDELLTYWVVELDPHGGFVRVTPAEAKRIDDALAAGIVEYIRFHDLAGSLCIWRRDCVRGMYVSDPETRGRGRQIDRLLKDEVDDESIPGVD